MSEKEVALIQNVRSLVYVGFLGGLGTVLHAVEGFLPPPVPLPGVKIGLANVVTLVTLFLLSEREALCVALLRIVLGSFLSGTFLGISFFLSLGGGISSFVVMCFTKRGGISPFWVSVLGALFHNLGQWLVASLYLQSSVLLFYLPLLSLFALPTGAFVGYLGMLLLRKEMFVKT
ncbi:Gx transporter family protein [Candidatus Caldatribacterium sp.]|uniref:Gx transporter family protein n=1 Tax=Candidatus Caldatribacterium sp. TaxID=2282143 RepID=UPI00299CAAFF|nr:Gx transporter family protein [Candidatus Caldatribacterium sp.]MDW8080299.1 Gx transporter family protein [Candidatus Calescibacterium sp.]